MSEQMQQFIGKECLIYTLNAQVTGTVEAVEGNWLAVRTADSAQADLINLDYISRIREYPRNKAGKKKSLVLD